MIHPRPATGQQALAEGLQRRAGRIAALLGQLDVELRRGREVLRERGPAVAARLARSASDLWRPRLLRQAVGALGRGNHEAAFWLLREELERRPDDAHTVLLFWNVAATCGRAAAAAEAMARLVQRQAASGERASAADSWIALVRDVPDAVVDPASLARILPELRARTERARDGASREESSAWLMRALRQSVDPRGGTLSPGLALRLFEEARGLDPTSARQAARVALESPDLHEAKRARLETWLRELERGAQDGAESPPAPACVERHADDAPAKDDVRVTEVKPVELAEKGLLVLELADERRARVDYRAIEAVAVAHVAGLAGDPVLVIDLALRSSPRHATRRRLLRMRADAFDPNALAPARARDGQALCSFLAELLERTRAVPLPDPESALGVRPRHFASLADYEHEILGRLRRCSAAAATT
jgi:hypothetical protein